MNTKRLNVESLVVESFSISIDSTVPQPIGQSECCSPLCVTDTSPCCCKDTIATGTAA